MTPTKRRACEGKRQHPTKQQAQAQLLRLVRAGTSPTRIHVYRCGYCKQYHVGHRAQGRRKQW